ncbi:hypothetical protein ACJJTC_007441 [Scirpophaga incertulas]
MDSLRRSSNILLRVFVERWDSPMLSVFHHDYTLKDINTISTIREPLSTVKFYSEYLGKLALKLLRSYYVKKDEFITYSTVHHDYTLKDINTISTIREPLSTVKFYSEYLGKLALELLRSYYLKKDEFITYSTVHHDYTLKDINTISTIREPLSTVKFYSEYLGKLALRTSPLLIMLKKDEFITYSTVHHDYTLKDINTISTIREPLSTVKFYSEYLGKLALELLRSYYLKKDEFITYSTVHHDYTLKDINTISTIREPLSTVKFYSEYLGKLALELLLYYYLKKDEFITYSTVHHDYTLKDINTISTIREPLSTVKFYSEYLGKLALELLLYYYLKKDEFITYSTVHHDYTLKDINTISTIREPLNTVSSILNIWVNSLWNFSALTAHPFGIGVNLQSSRQGQTLAC